MNLSDIPWMEPPSILEDFDRWFALTLMKVRWDRMLRSLPPSPPMWDSTADDHLYMPVKSERTKP